jgi:hypothetical protein
VTWAIQQKYYSQRRACGLPLPVPSSRRCQAAREAARACPGAPPLRLSAPAHPAPAGGYRGEPQAPVPALSRGAAYGQEAQRPQARTRHPCTDDDPARAQTIELWRLVEVIAMGLRGSAHRPLRRCRPLFRPVLSGCARAHSLLDGTTGRRGLHLLPMGLATHHVHVWKSFARTSRSSST